MTDRPTRLRELQLKRDYDPDSRPRDTFYVPCLQVASRYDRFAGYFRAASLEAVADEGLQAFFANHGRIRIVVDAHLTEQDVADVRRGAEVGGDVALREAVKSQVEQAVLRAELPGSDRLSLVATLVAAGLMQVKVAVAEGSDGVPLEPGHPARQVFHDKVGILWDDEEDAVAFRGSLNETPSGWARNYEGFSVYPSWDLTVWDSYGAPLVERFDRAWGQGRAGHWRLFDLPDPAVDRLIDFADPERDWVNFVPPDPGDKVVEPLAPPATPPEVPGGPVDVTNDTVVSAASAVESIRAERWSGVRTSTVAPWPHQDAAAREVADALWPPEGEQPEFGRMFADEVGLGKTIEVGLVIREAVSNRNARRVLVLAPASVAPQWQGELWDKFALWVPLYDRDKLLWPDGTTSQVEGDPWRSHDLLIASSHLARLQRHRTRVVDAGWDLLVVDEAHHARRADSTKPGSANLLLRLLRDAQAATSVRRLVLATATPMQMHVHEAWELLNVLGLPDAWHVDAFADYWDQLAADRPHDQRAWPRMQQLLAATVERWGLDRSIEGALEDRVGFADAQDILRWHDAAEPSRVGNTWPRHKRDALVWWLSEQTPLRHLVHRASRDLLRHYKTDGIIGRDVVIPARDADEVPVDLATDEQRLYDRIETWISRHYQAAKDAKKPGHGFVMTTYRRRLTSSLNAIRVSLERRAGALTERRDDAQQTLNLSALLDTDDVNVIQDTEDTYLDTELADEIAGVDDELDEVTGFLADIARVLEDGGDKDSKYRKFEGLLRHTLYSGAHATCIVFTQYTDTMVWLRDHLSAALGAESVATYSGQGGQLPDGKGGWRPASKGEVTTAFRDAATNDNNQLKILLGTDSMSEGLNLQTCDLLINYDLPWNFMRVEQRIGRIDRIGGPEIAHIRNLLIVGTVEERVYRGIVDDHDTFGRVIGPTGKVTGDPSMVLNSTEAAITGALLGDEDVEEVLERMREQARTARARALTAGTFDHTPLTGHDPHEGPWEFDRDGIFERLSEALDPLLPAPGEDGYWTIITDHHGPFRVVLEPEMAIDNPDLSLLVWGSPALDALLVSPARRTAGAAAPDRGAPDVMFETSDSILGV